MPRALIVEDERMTRETLRTLVPWGRLGVEEVETARDGVDALGRIERHMPDLLICDIRMPRMGGIELARIVRERNPACGIVFLSGYSEKEYLKAAIRLQAADYLDKPVNLQEVSAAVERNVRALQARASTTAETERARRVLSEVEPVLREALAAALARPGVDPAELRARTEPRVLAPFLGGPLRWAVAEPVEAPGAGPAAEGLLAEAVRALDGAPPPAPLRGLAACPCAPGRLALLAAGEALADDAAAERALEALGPALGRAFAPAGFRLGIGPPVRALEAAPDSWAGARAALEQRFFAPARRFLHPPAPGGPPPLRLEEAELEPLRAALREPDLEEAGAWLERLAARAAGQAEAPAVREAYARALAAVLEAAPAFEPAELRAEQDRLRAAVRAQPTLAALAGLAGDTLRRCFAPGSAGAAAERRIARIREYIRAHHADPDLLVETVAADVGLSESYLCTVFKQACGITVKDHLTRVRIEKAKELLRETRDKLQAVALQVGFRDANYFSTVFKREVGITPREYRERSQP